MLMLVLTGLVAGAVHAVSGPDHVAAVLPLATESPDRGGRIGLSWATGHGLGTVLLAAFATTLRHVLDLPTLGAHAETLVGVLLVVTGLWTLFRPHTHRPAATLGAAAGIGTVHGAAGGAHLVVAGSALALPLASSALWLGGFVLGAAVAMSAVGYGLQLAGPRLKPGWMDRLRIGSGVLAVVVGVVWAGSQLLG